jgi:hypothetical protein
LVSIKDGVEGKIKTKVAEDAHEGEKICQKR